MGSSSDVETRKMYLSHEASIQGIGMLYLLGAAFLGLAILLMLGGILTGQAGGQEAVVTGVLCLVYLGLLWLQIWVGRGLRSLNPKVRTPAIVLSVIGLLGFPIGTIVSAYVLYLLASKKGEFVFSAEYARVREATPEIKYRTSWIVWVFLILLVALIVMGLLGALLAR